MVAAPAVEIATGVARSIRQHARSSIKTEVCGILIGDDDEGRVNVRASIQGINASQGGAHVTFTQETWEHIYQIKDRDYPDDRIVGWYHSHPAFGIFLSDHDLFIHQNFFSSPLQVAWVYDPVSDEEGCFGWIDGKIERLARIVFDDREQGRGSPLKSEHPVDDEEHDWPLNLEHKKAESNSGSIPRWVRWANIAVSHLTVLVLGFAAAMYMFRLRTDEAIVLGYINGARDCARGQLVMDLPLPKGVTLTQLLGNACTYPVPPPLTGLETPSQNPLGKKK
jgi:proteasome lid subunit RPN8/RPN11